MLMFISFKMFHSLSKSLNICFSYLTANKLILTFFTLETRSKNVSISTLEAYPQVHLYFEKFY